MTPADDPATTSFGGQGLGKGEAAPRLSIHDQAGVIVGTTISEALAGSTAQAVLADKLGYHRYWVAEHHGTPSNILGSSEYAARLAARLGLPFAFAYHFEGVADGTERRSRRTGRSSGRRRDWASRMR